jgi:hypothetical protein
MKMPFAGGVRLWKMFSIRDSLRPGQEEKWPRHIAGRKVKVEGLKAQPCSKAASSLFVCLLWIMLLAKCRGVVQVEGHVLNLGASGMFQSLLVGFLFR